MAGSGERAPIEDWLAEGSLSSAEFDQLVRLSARYFCYDADQFDHWRMPGPWGSFHLTWDSYPASPDRESAEAYRIVWPTVPVGASGFAVIETAAGGAERELARFARPEVAELLRDSRARHEADLDSGRTYLVRPV